MSGNYCAVFLHDFCFGSPQFSVRPSQHELETIRSLDHRHTQKQTQVLILMVDQKWRFNNFQLSILDHDPGYLLFGAQPQCNINLTVSWSTECPQSLFYLVWSQGQHNLNNVNYQLPRWWIEDRLEGLLPHPDIQMQGAFLQGAPWKGTWTDMRLKRRR